MNPDDRALALAARIADGSAIDWPTPEARSSHGEEDALLEELKAIAAVATLHRAPSDWPTDAVASATTRWGPLTVLEKIGEGRFGYVYAAWDARLQRRVALKLLHTASPGLSDSPTSAIEEARLLARVRHPNVLTVHGAESIDGQVGIWTEFIEGRTLNAVLAERRPMPAEEVVSIGLDLCRALAAVHGAGLLHRDIKAQNVMREIGGRIVLMDFGTGHDLAAVPTRAGDLSGTPLYLAPELYAGGPATPSSDIYALAVLLFYLLTGQYPVPGRTLDDVRTGHRKGRTRRLQDVRPDLSDALMDAVDRGLSPDPRGRYQSAEAFELTLNAAQTALEQAAAKRGRDSTLVTRRQPAIGWTWIAAAASAVAALGAASWLDAGHVRNRVSRWFSGAIEQYSPVVQTVRLPQLDMGRPSRDGRFLPYVDENGDLQVWERATARAHRAFEKGASGETVLMSAMSPTGDRVAYAVSTPLEGWELRVVNADGTSPSVLIAHERVFTPVPMAWSQDGASVLCEFRQQDGSADLALVSATGGPLRVLQTLHGAAPGNVSLSSDGRYLVYYRRPDPKKSTIDLFILGTDGSPPRVLLEAHAGDAFAMWTPDAHRVFFMRNSPTFEGSKDGWILPVMNGVATGDPTRVLSNLGPAYGQAALTDSGALLYMLSTNSNDVYTSSLDLSGTTAPGPPMRISATQVGHHASPAFSPNGQTIAYMTTRESPARTVLLKTLMIQDRQTGRETEVHAQLSVLDVYSPRWMPDSLHVIVWGKDPPGRSGYFKVDTHTGETSAILLADKFASFVCSPDGRTLLYVDRRGIVARDLASGAENVTVARGQWSAINFLSLSPNGQLAFVATTDGSGNWIQSLEVRAPTGARELMRVRFPEWLLLDAWTPDGQDLLFSRFVPEGPGGISRPMTLWRIAASRGEPRDMHLSMGTGLVNAAALSPDGRQIAYGEGTNFWQLLAVDRFLPAAHRVP